MNFFIIISLFAFGLFLLAFLTKRRFGTLGLALAAGSLLSSLWVGNVTPLIEQSGLVLVAPPLSAVVAAGLTLLPALLLILSGPKYKGGWQRTFGSLAFAALAVALLIDVFGSALMLDEVGTVVYQAIADHKNLIVTAGLILAIIDLFVTKTPKSVDKDKSKH